MATADYTDPAAKAKDTRGSFQMFITVAYHSHLIPEFMAHFVLKPDQKVRLAKRYYEVNGLQGLDALYRMNLIDEKLKTETITNTPSNSEPIKCGC